MLSPRGERVARVDRAQRARHELRGALSAISLGVEASRRAGCIPAARARALELELERAVEALECLSGRAVEVPAGELVDVAALLRDSAEAWRPAAGEARAVELELARCHGALVRGSRARLARATGNLIANAIEHGAGTIRVSARVVGESVRVEVRDEGPGLPLPLADVMRGRRAAKVGWLRFGWLRFAWPRADQAHGHGLRIVDEVASVHGGRLELAPSTGGARFILELPLARPVAPAATDDRRDVP